MSFGGAVWWFTILLSVTVLVLVLTKLTQHLLLGRFFILRSPLTLLGFLVLTLAVFQLAPLPVSLARLLSPMAHDAYARSVLPSIVSRDDPEVKLPEPLPIRSPASVDRPATLRWLVLASACLGIFWVTSHFTDRLERLYLVWGLIIASFVLNTAFAAVQLTNRHTGLYGMFLPGNGPMWAPSLDDALSAPTLTVLKNLPETKREESGLSIKSARVVLVPVIPFLFGTLMGGAGAFLAIGALAMPLALGIVFHLALPRGGREQLSERLGRSSRGSLLVLLMGFMFVAVIVIGLTSGLWYCLPICVGLLIVIVPGLRRSDAQLLTMAIAVLLSGGLASGVAFRAWWPSFLGDDIAVGLADSRISRPLWSTCWEICREFPLVGTGMGTFSSIYPYYKTMYISSTTGMSTLLQWSVEAGSIGVGLLVIGGCWSLIKLPGGISRVRPVDRPLIYGLIGAAMSFGILAAIHWTIELNAVAISASALGGIWNRWLAGGTDLFVERG